MPQLYNVDSPITREQRNNLNATFQDILTRFNNLRYQISVLSGGSDLEDVIQRIEDTIINANNTTANTQQVLNDISDALNQLSTALQNSNDATNSANNAANNVQSEILNIQNLVNELGNAESYDNSKTYLKNNVVEYNGSSFMAIQETTGNLPPILPTKRNDFWQLLAQRGIDGTGSVSTVNGISPNVDGDVILSPISIGAANESDFTSLQQRFNTHSNQSTAYQYVLNRDLSITGIQTVSIYEGKIPQKIEIFCSVYPNFKHCIGVYHRLGNTYVLSISNDFKSLPAGNKTVTIADSETARTEGIIKNVTSSSFDIEWEHVGVGAIGNATLFITVNYHGGE